MSLLADLQSLRPAQKGGVVEVPAPVFDQVLRLIEEDEAKASNRPVRQPRVFPERFDSNGKPVPF